MARKQNDAVSSVDNSDEDVFPSLELLLEATKFDEANVSHDVLKIENQSEGLEETVMFKL